MLNVLVVWLVGAAITFLLCIHTWRLDWDVEGNDVVFFALLSLVTGPIGIISGLFILFVTKSEKKPHRVFWKRYE